jgi:hypothetical protein
MKDKKKKKIKRVDFFNYQKFNYKKVVYNSTKIQYD